MMVVVSSLHVSPPLQERSRETLDSLLRAAKSQLKERTFAEVTVTSVVAEAGSSAGSFYARFGDKTAMLHALHEQFVNESVAHAEETLSSLGERRLTVEELAGFLVGGVVRGHGENRGVIRAVLIESLRDPVFAERASGLVRRVAVLAAAAIASPNTGRAGMASRIEVGILTLMAVLDQDLFFGTALSTAQRSGDDLPTHDAERLRRIFLAAVDSPQDPSADTSRNRSV